MFQRTRLSIIVAILILAGTGLAAAQQCPAVYHQVTWLEQGGQRFTASNGPSEDFAWGGPVSLQNGDLVRLRTVIRNPNRGSNDYQPTVTYGFTSSKGQGVVRIESDGQKPEVQKLGMVELRVLREGSTTLTYKMMNLDHPSQRDPQKALGNASCSKGQIRIASSTPEAMPPASPTPDELGFERAALLYDAILLRPLSQGEAPLYVQQLGSGSFSDIVDVARQIADSPESKIQVPERLNSELGRMDLTPETRTTRMLEVLVGQISTRDRLWESTYQSLVRNKVADAVEQALRDPRFREKNGSLAGSDARPQQRRSRNRG